MTVAPSRLTAPEPTPAPAPGNRVVLRLDLACGARVGPGKVALLEAIERTGSISAAGRAMRMSYRRAWELVEDLNRHCGTPVVAAAAGGTGGGGARLTEIGAAIVAEYRALEAEAAAAAKGRFATLEALCPSH
jgi:molybdate transport system regulatory protein